MAPALSIIAYRQPVTRNDIDTLRGVDSGAVLKVLLDSELIEIVGRKKEVGTPLLYGTTNLFLSDLAFQNCIPIHSLIFYKSNIA